MSSVWNNPNVRGVEKRAGGWVKGFRDFILRGNVVDLAVGIVIGAAFTAIVNGFVGDIITPLIPATHGTGLSGAYYQLPYPGGGKLMYGAFINSVLSFLIIAFVIYFFVVKPVNTLMTLYKKGTPEVTTTKDCPYCLSSVPLMATRCAYCTSPLPPVQAQQQAPQPPPPLQR